jgi:hypothetical protein
MKTKARQFKAYLLHRRKFGVPDLHVGGFYVTLDGSVVVCAEKITQRHQPQTMTTKDACLVLAGGKPETPPEPCEDYGMALVQPTGTKYKVGSGYVVDADADTDFIELTPIYEVDLKFQKMKLNDGENKA